LLCVLVAAGSHNPLLFSEFNAQARNVTLYRLDNTAQTYNDVKLVAGLPNILGSGVTACNAKTCFVAPLSPSTGPVVFSIDLATKAVGYSYFYHYSIVEGLLIMYYNTVGIW
jgi:hypothetical protein